MPFQLEPQKPPKQAEADVVKTCLDYLKLRGYYPIRQHCGKFWTWDKLRIITGADKGTPDWAFMHAVYPGFLLEAKRPGEEPSAQQALTIRDIYIGYRLDIVVIDNIDTLRAFVDRREKRLREQWRAMSS